MVFLGIVKEILELDLCSNCKKEIKKLDRKEKKRIKSLF